MKTKLQTLTAISILMFSMAAAPAQPVIDPRTGLPMPAAGGQPTLDPNTGLAVPAPGAEPTIDPRTGMPLPPDNLQMDAGWKDPDKVISEIRFPEGIPVSDMVHYLREQFTNQFDIIIPNTYKISGSADSVDPNSYSVKLELRNVKASEIFRAMNLEFQIENTPFQWELMVNGTRPTALLRVLPNLAAAVPAAPPTKRMVFFLGELGVEQTGGTNEEKQLDEITETISQVWKTSGVMSSTGTFEVYRPAQLLIVNGTPDQIDLTRQTLAAMKEKAELKALESKLDTGAPASGKSTAPK